MTFEFMEDFVPKASILMENFVTKYLSVLNDLPSSYVVGLSKAYMKLNYQ